MQQEIKDINPFITALKECSGLDFSQYSTRAIQRRVNKLQRDFSIGFDDLVERTRADEPFRHKVLKKLTVDTTDLFRDIELWDHLKKNILPGHFQARTLSVWHAGCSTGLEVYSILILLHVLGLFPSCNVLATDIQMAALNTAKEGIFQFQFGESYAKNFDKVINSEKTDRKISCDEYFETDTLGRQIIMKDFLRKKPHFYAMNLLTDQPPPGYPWDIIFCRNVLMYFKPDLQNRVLELFYQTMNENACLILGKHEETNNSLDRLFENRAGIWYKR